MIFGGKSGGDTAELEAKIKELEAENQRIREALQFYADPKHWTEGHKYRDMDEATIYQEEDTSCDVDRGAVALKALKGK